MGSSKIKGHDPRVGFRGRNEGGALPQGGPPPEGVPEARAREREKVAPRRTVAAVGVRCGAANLGR